MCRQRIARVLIAGLLVLGPALDAPSQPEPPDLMVIGGTDTVVLVAQDTRFDARLQLQTNLRAGIGIRFSNVQIAAGVGIDRARATSAAPGYSYPGWTSRTAWASGSLTSLGSSALGLRSTASFNFAGFDSTYLLTFFPAFEIAPQLTVAASGGLSIILSLPLGWQMRRELAVRVGSDITLRGVPFIGASLRLAGAMPRLQ